ncbi:MAG: DUF4349 domain-containing protein [Planctomycetota bacterium]
MRIATWISIGFLSLSIGCASIAPSQRIAASESSAANYSNLDSGLVQRDAIAASPVAERPRQVTRTDDEGPKSPSDRLMIYEGRFSVLTAQPEERISRFVSGVQARGGYLVEQDDRRVTCRVPADRFDETIASVRGFGQVVREHVTAQDVSREFMDLDIRIENAERSRTRLLALLERAEKVEDILRIEEQLRRLTEEIERMKGSLRYMSERIAFSLISVEFRVPKVRRDRAVARPSRFPWVRQVGIRSLLERF